MQDVENSTNRMNSVLGGSASGLDRMADSIGKVGSSLSSVGGMMTAAITLPLTGVAVAALKVAGDLEQAKVAFTGMMGSAAAAQQHLDALREFANKTPFEFNELINASRKLQAFGFSAQEVIPTLTKIGDAAAGLGLGAAGIDRITLALGQMSAKGKVSAQEMNQIAETGIKGWDMLAAAITKATGKTTTVADTMKLAEGGKINGAAAVQVLLDGMGSQFQGQMDKQAETMLGRLSTVSDQVKTLLAGIGQALMPLGKAVIEGVSSAIPQVQKLVDVFAGLPVPIQGAIVGLAGLAAAAGPTLFIVGNMASGVSALIKAFEVLRGMEIFGGIAQSAAVAEGAIAQTAVAASGLSTALTVGLAAAAAALAGIALNVGGIADKMGAFLDRQGINLFEILKGAALGMNPMEIAANSALASAQAVAQRDRTSRVQTQSEADAAKSAVDAREAEIAKRMSGGGGSPSLLQSDAAKAAKEAAKELAGAFSAFGLTNHSLQVEELTRKYNLLKASGKATAEQLQQAWDQVVVAMMAANPTERYGPFKPFDLSTLGDLSRPLDEMVKRTASALDLQKHELQSYLDFMKKWAEDVRSANRRAFDQAAATTAMALMSPEEQVVNYLDKNPGAEALVPYDPRVTALERLQRMRESDEAERDIAKQFEKSRLEGGLSVPGLDQFGNSINLGVDDNSQLGKVLSTGGVANAAKQIDDLNDALQRLGIAQRANITELKAAIKDLEQAQKQGKLTNLQSMQLDLARVNVGIAQRQEQGLAPTVQQGEARFKAERALKDTELDVYMETRKRVEFVMGSIRDGLADAVLHAKNFGDAMKQAFIGLGENLFKDVFGRLFDQITRPLTDKLTSLFSGVVDKITSKLLGKGVDAASSALGAGVDAAAGLAGAGADVASKAGGTASKAVGSVVSGGLSATVGMISGAASAVSSVIGNFQMSGMNKSLDLIVNHTLRIYNDLANLRNDLWEQHHLISAQLENIRGAIGDGAMMITEVVHGLWEAVLNQGLGIASGGGTAAAVESFVESKAGTADVQATEDAAARAQKEAAEAKTEAAEAEYQAAMQAKAAAEAQMQAAQEQAAAAESTSEAVSDGGFSVPSVPFNPGSSQGVVQAILALNETTGNGLAAILSRLQEMNGFGGPGTGSGGGGTGSVDPFHLRFNGPGLDSPEAIRSRITSGSGIIEVAADSIYRLGNASEEVARSLSSVSSEVIASFGSTYGVGEVRRGVDFGISDIETGSGSTYGVGAVTRGPDFGSMETVKYDWLGRPLQDYSSVPDYSFDVNQFNGVPDSVYPNGKFGQHVTIQFNGPINSKDDADYATKVIMGQM